MGPLSLEETIQVDELCRGMGLVKDRILLGWNKKVGIRAFLDPVHDEIHIC
jgi:hypothetical protein